MTQTETGWTDSLCEAPERIWVSEAYRGITYKSGVHGHKQHDDDVEYVRPSLVAKMVRALKRGKSVFAIEALESAAKELESSTPERSIPAGAIQKRSVMTSTNWTDEFPQNEETFYWTRHKQNHRDINVGLLRDETLLLAEGTTHGKSRRKDFEYLPASPSDAEQLMELRKLVREFVAVYIGKEALLKPDAQELFLRFRAALNPDLPKERQ